MLTSTGMSLWNVKHQVGSTCYRIFI